MIVSKDLNGIIRSWNPAATRIFGYSPDEMIGMSILKLIPEDLHSDETTILENIRAGRRVEHLKPCVAQERPIARCFPNRFSDKKRARPGYRRIQDFARYLRAQTA